MVTAKQVINSTKPKRMKVPTGPTKLGSAGYDNVRDDIEKVKKVREIITETIKAKTVSAPAGEFDTIATDTDGDITFLNDCYFTNRTGHDTFLDFVADEHIDWTDTTENFKTAGDITGDTLILDSGGTQDYKFISSPGYDSRALAIQGQTANIVSRIGIFSKTGDGGDPVLLRMWGKGTPESTAGGHNMLLGWIGGDYYLNTGSGNLLISAVGDIQLSATDLDTLGNSIKSNTGTVIVEDDLLIANSDLSVSGGRIFSGTKTITASSDNTDVSGVNTLFINPAATVVIGGFAGGVDGQVLHVIIVDGDQTVTLENEEATGTQKLAMHESSDETLTRDRGGFTFVYNSITGFWHDCSHARHV